MGAEHSTAGSGAYRPFDPPATTAWAAVRYSMITFCWASSTFARRAIPATSLFQLPTVLESNISKSWHCVQRVV
jgi:hypothetical protein